MTASVQILRSSRSEREVKERSSADVKNCQKQMFAILEYAQNQENPRDFLVQKM